MTTTHIIKHNPDYNSREVYFTEKPSAEIIDALKGLRMRCHNQKHCWYGFASADEIENAINGKPSEIAKPTKKPVENALGVKVGDVFYESWGYEQTNIDFWQVVALRGKTQIVLRAIASEVVSTPAAMQAYVKPKRDVFTSHYAGEEIVRTVKGTAEHPCCNAKHGLLSATTWDAEHHETSYY